MPYQPKHSPSIVSDPAVVVVVVVVMIMIDLTVTASDDVESSANVEWNFQQLTLRCTSKLQMLALTAFPANINSLPFLFLLVILQFSSQALLNRSVAKCYGLIGNINLLRMAPHPGKSAPQVGCDENTKNAFWNELEAVTMKVPHKETPVLAGDLNGHVGESQI